MTGVLQSPDSQLVAECEHCGVVCERSLEDGETLSAADNKEIVARVARSHSFKCRRDGDEWGERVSVEIDTTAAPRGGES